MDDMHRAQRRPSLDDAEANQKHIASYPKVPSRMASSTQLPLHSVRSEGSNAMMNPRSALAPALAPFSPLAAARQRRVLAAEDDNSSDESAGEEVIVRVDSPSMLSFHLSSGPLPQGD